MGRDYYGRRAFGHDYNHDGSVFGYREHVREDFGRREPHRPPKIPFPTFNGEFDPLTWLNKSDNYFCGHRMPEDEEVWMASLHLNGTTMEWYY